MASIPVGAAVVPASLRTERALRRQRSFGQSERLRPFCRTPFRPLRRGGETDPPPKKNTFRRQRRGRTFRWDPLIMT